MNVWCLGKICVLTCFENGVNLKIYIKYMVSNRCKMAVKEELKKLGLHFVVVELGEVDVMEVLTAAQRNALQIGLQSSGLELMDDKRAVMIEKVIHVITEMIHHTEEMPKVNYSDFISAQVGYDYTYLSNVFSEVKGITIQQFIILHKIERVKELLLYEELNLTEISYRMHYSSVAHLSNQFKKVTGLTPSQFKQLKNPQRSPIEEIGNGKAQHVALDVKESSAMDAPGIENGDSNEKPNAH